MSDSANIRHLEELLLLVQTGDASDSQIDELNELLRSDAELRTAATSVLRFDLMLQEELPLHASGDALNDSTSRTEAASSLAGTVATVHQLDVPSTPEEHTEFYRLADEPTSHHHVQSQYRGRFFTWLLATAAVVLAVASLSFLFRGRDQYTTRTTDSDLGLSTITSHSAPTPFAVLVQTHECVWVGMSEYFEGKRLSAGTLELKSGLAEIRFDSGISTILEGPAALDLVDMDRAKLQFGSVVVEGADTDISLRLGTPQGEIVDIGTRYSTAVSRDQDSTEIHVFDGSVLVHRQDYKDLTIREGEAIRLGVQSVITIPVAPNSFAQMIPIDDSNAADWLLAHEPFEYDKRTFEYHNGTDKKLAGGFGFTAPWKSARHYMAIGNEETAKAQYLSSSLGSRALQIQATGGAIQLSGGMMLQRELSTPIDLSRDGVYYLSFLIRRSSETLPKFPGIGHWGNLTFGLESQDGFRRAKTERSVRFGMSFQQPDINDVPRFHPVVCVAPGHRALGLPTVKEEVTYLFVGKILASADGPDQVLLRVYRQRDKIEPSEPAAWNAASPMEYSDDVCTHVKLKAVDANPYTFDELRIGRTWRSVLPVSDRDVNISNE